MKMTSAEILVQGLTLECHVGVTSVERSRTQRVLVDIACTLDNPTFRNDSIRETVDYAAVAAIAQNIAHSKACRLLETLATAIAYDILVAHGRIKSLVIIARKPRKIPGCEALGVKLSFSNDTAQRTNLLKEKPRGPRTRPTLPKK